MSEGGSSCDPCCHGRDETGAEWPPTALAQHGSGGHHRLTLTEFCSITRLIDRSRFMETIESPKLSPLAVSPRRAAQYLDVGHDAIYTLLNQGRIRSVKLGRRRLIP